MTILSTDVSVDHVVFHAGQALDELAEFFERAGFQLTALGRHSSGSVNRLAMLQGQYIELFGFEPGTPRSVRPDLQAMSPGLNGIVAADRADGPARRRGGCFLPGVRLRRPVDTPQVKGVAEFTITYVRNSAPDVRSFMCRHHTRDLVWHEAWQAHPNGALSLDRIRLATNHPEQLHQALDHLFDVEGGGLGTSYDAAGMSVELVPSGQRALLSIRVARLDSAADVLRRSGVQHTIHPDRVEIPLPPPHAVDLILEGRP